MLLPCTLLLVALIEGLVAGGVPPRAGPRVVRLGSSDLHVCQVCLGTMTMGSMSDESTSHRILDRYVELGGNFIDTAEMYPVPCDRTWLGSSEEIIGRWLAKRPEQRSQLVIATKVSGPRGPSDRVGMGGKREQTLAGQWDEDAALPDFSAAQIRRALDASLERLQTDYVDLYQLHWPERYVPLWGEAQYSLDKERALVAKLEGFDEVVSTMGALVREGKIRHWGISNETPFGVCSFYESARRQGVPPPISIQNDFSLCFRSFEEGLAEACSEGHCNLGLLAYGVLNGGALSAKYLDGTEEAGSRFRFAKPGFQARYYTERANAAIREYAQIAHEEGLTAATLAQAWAYSRWYMGAVIIGATSIGQLEENWRAASVTLSEDTLRKIEEVHLRHRNPNLYE